MESVKMRKKRAKMERNEGEMDPCRGQLGKKMDQHVEYTSLASK